MNCENCGKANAIIRRVTEHHSELPFCSESCAKETAEFYAAGNFGAFGFTTREVKEINSKKHKGDTCCCWTTERNRICSILHNSPIIHSADCPNREVEAVH